VSLSDRPNVVFVLTDDQGYGDLACHGNPIIRTPNLDRMHDESVRLHDYHVGPTCAPTRAGLMTGHYANSTGVWHTVGGRSLLRRNEISAADFFARAGYATGIFGKWHLGDNYPFRPQDRGFQEIVTFGGGGVGTTPDYWGNDYFDDTYWTHRDGIDGYVPYRGYCTDVWFDEALRFIERHRDEPFFCYLSPNAPHMPWLVPPEYSDPYVASTPHRDRANFYGMITKIDEDFGILRDRLAEWGLAESTILIFSTDNGTVGIDLDEHDFVVNGHNAGMRGGKGSEYDGGHRVPFFIHWPGGGLTEGRDIDVVTANVDVVPTLIDLCGLGDWREHDFDGRSLASLIQGTHATWEDRAVVTDSQRVVDPIKWRQSAVMTDRWRLVNGSALYEIDRDPEQRTDVAADHPAVVAELRQAYEAWWLRVSTRFDEEIPIVVGDPDSRHVLLTTHEWRGDEWHLAWSQNQIREGVICNGYWELEIADAGTFRFELRRWPREEDRALTEGIPGGPPVSYFDQTIESGFGGGNAIPIRGAALRIGDQEASRAVAPDDHSATFTLDLSPGPTHLQTFLDTGDESDLGAYYVYVDRLDIAAVRAG
jgi:arylsulfatase A-like enzyme